MFISHFFTYSPSKLGQSLEPCRGWQGSEEIEKQQNFGRWERLSYSQIGRINIVKMTLLPKVAYIFNGFSTKIPAKILYKARKSNHKIYMEAYNTQIPHSNNNPIITRFQIILHCHSDKKIVCQKTVMLINGIYRKDSEHIHAFTITQYLETMSKTHLNISCDFKSVYIWWSLNSSFSVCHWYYTEIHGYMFLCKWWYTVII